MGPMAPSSHSAGRGPDGAGHGPFGACLTLLGAGDTSDGAGRLFAEGPAPRIGFLRSMMAPVSLLFSDLRHWQPNQPC